MIGPKGKFMLEPDDDRTHLFISSGTGNAPVRLDDAPDPRATGRPRRAVFLNGVSYARDLGYREILEDWEATGGYPVTLHPDRLPARRSRERRLDGRTGRVETVVGAGARGARADARRHDRLPVRQPGHDPRRPRRRCSGSGFPEDAVKKELYWPKGKEPRGAAAADLAAAIDAAEANADQ